MLKKMIFAAAAFALSAPVLADRGHRDYDKHYWKRHDRPVVVVPPPHVYYAPPPRVYYAPPPRVYYAPPPRVYYAPPPRVYYAPPPSVYYAPPPVYYSPRVPQSGISVRLHFPL